LLQNKISEVPMSEKKKIFIIDDDKDYGEALKIVLESNG
jgi:FixJ family two-component response regulator